MPKTNHLNTAAKYIDKQIKKLLAESHKHGEKANHHLQMKNTMIEQISSLHEQKKVLLKETE